MANPTLHQLHSAFGTAPGRPTALMWPSAWCVLGFAAFIGSFFSRGSSAGFLFLIAVGGLAGGITSLVAAVKQLRSNHIVPLLHWFLSPSIWPVVRLTADPSGWVVFEVTKNGSRDDGADGTSVAVLRLTPLEFATLCTLKEVADLAENFVWDDLHQRPRSLATADDWVIAHLTVTINEQVRRFPIEYWAGYGFVCVGRTFTRGYGSDLAAYLIDFTSPARVAKLQVEYGSYCAEIITVDGVSLGTHTEILSYFHDVQGGNEGLIILDAEPIADSATGIPTEDVVSPIRDNPAASASKEARPVAPTPPRVPIRRRFDIYQGAGEQWLKVTLWELDVLGIAGAISRSSRMGGGVAFLKDGRDSETFTNAWSLNGGRPWDPIANTRDGSVTRVPWIHKLTPYTPHSRGELEELELLLAQFKAEVPKRKGLTAATLEDMRAWAWECKQDASDMAAA